MDKKPLIVVSLCAVVLLVLGSLSNVVGYQTVQSSNQQTIKERINQRELLFQTICDIANNKEIQRTILKSQMSRGIFPTSEFPVVTKTQIRQMYFFGLILSKVISKSRIQSLVGKYQFNNQGLQKEISTVIEKDAILNAEITQLKSSDCDCEDEKTMNWNFPVLCVILGVIKVPIDLLQLLSEFLAQRLSDEGKITLAMMFNLSAMILLFLCYTLFVIGFYLQCWGPPAPL